MVIGVSREDICRFPYTKHPVLGDIDYITHMHDLSMVKKKEWNRRKRRKHAYIYNDDDRDHGRYKRREEREKVGFFIVKPLIKKNSKTIIGENIVQKEYCTMCFWAEILKI